MKSVSNNSLIAFASIAGLAVGAALGVLFAPKKGRDIRSKLSFKRWSEQEDKAHHHSEPIAELWSETRNHADHLQGPAKKRKNPSTIKVPSAGTTAWKENKIEEQPKHNYSHIDA